MVNRELWWQLAPTGAHVLQVGRITPKSQSCHLCALAESLYLSKSSLGEKRFDEMIP